MEFQNPLSFTAFFIFLISFFWFRRMTKEDRRTKTPPGPTMLPLIGNIHQFVGVQHHLLRDLARKHGPLKHLKIAEISAIVVSSPRVAIEVLKTHDVAFADRPAFVATKIMFEGVDLGFSPYGAYWRQMHKIICVMELLSKRNVRSFHSIRQEEVQTLVASLQSLSGSIINLTEQVYSLSNAIIDVFIRLSREFVSLFSRTKPKITKIHQQISEIVDNIINEQKQARTAEMKVRAHKYRILEGFFFPIV